MSRLSQDQIEKEASIRKSATIWGVIAGVIVALLALWILSGQGGAIRYGGAVIIGLVVAALVFRASFNSGAKNAKCSSCGAAFSISRTDRSEELASSEKKEKREELEDGSTKIMTWTEEIYDVTETFSCAKCNDVTTKNHKTTRRKDEDERVEPAPKPEPAKGTKKSAKSGGKKGDSTGGKKRSRGRGRS